MHLNKAGAKEQDGIHRTLQVLLWHIPRSFAQTETYNKLNQRI